MIFCMRRKSMAFWIGLGLCAVLAGCGIRDEGKVPENVEQEIAVEHSEASEEAEADTSYAEDYGLSGKQRMEEQSFEVELFGGEKQEFVSYAPGEEENAYTDVVFALQNSDGRVIQILEGMREDNLRAAAEVFDAISAVAFRDYDGDGDKDVLIIAGYSYVQGPDAGNGFSEVRIYQNTGTQLALQREVSSDATSALVEPTIDSVLGFLNVPYAEDSAATGNGKDFREACAQALWDIYAGKCFPDGRTMDYTGDGNDLDDNSFAIFDVDGDGREELLVNYVTTAVAGMLGVVYEYDTVNNCFQEEFVEFPALTFYDNGVVFAGASHNQGMSNREDFWPYSVYQYDAASDSYEPAAYVDAWDAAYWETDYNGNAFPEELDKDGDRMIYILYEGEQEYYLDGEEYQSWRAAYLEGANEIAVPYVPLTEEQIDALR